MIAFVRGRVAAVGPDEVVVEVGGVGLALRCTPGTIAGLRVGRDAHLPTALVVREDSLTLFGFADEDERELFDILQTASGVGPRLALAVLAVHRPDDVRRAITTGDLAALTRVPGIGRKGAERIVLELRDRVGPPARPVTAATAAVPAGWREQVLSGLVSLGWVARDAQEAVAAVEPEAAAAVDAGGQPEVATLLRAALQALDRA